MNNKKLKNININEINQLIKKTKEDILLLNYELQEKIKYIKEITNNKNK